MRQIDRKEIDKDQGRDILLAADGKNIVVFSEGKADRYRSLFILSGVSLFVLTKREAEALDHLRPKTRRANKTDKTTPLFPDMKENRKPEKTLW